MTNIPHLEILHFIKMNKKIKFNVLREENIIGTNIEINSVKLDGKTVKSTELGEVKHNICGTCHETKLSGCNGHFGKLNLGNNVMFNPAFKHILISLLKNYCFLCKLIKNPELIYLSEKYFETKDPSFRKKFFKLLSEKQLKCLNLPCNASTSFKIEKKQNWIIKFKYENEPKICQNREILEMLRNTPKSFIRLYIGTKNFNATFENLFIYNYLYIPSNYIRSPNFIENMETHIHTKILNDIVGAVIKSTDRSEREIQKYIIAMDNSKGGDAYAKTSISFPTLATMTGNPKDGLPRMGMVGRRLDQTIRGVCGPSRENIGIVGIPHEARKVISYNLFFNRVTESFIRNLLNKGDSDEYNFEVKSIIFNKTMEDVTPSKIYNVTKGKRLEIVHNLSYGDIVEISKPEGTIATFSTSKENFELVL